MFAQTPTLTSSLDARRKALNSLIDEEWDHRMRTTPEYASFLGDKRFNDQISDVSIAGVQRLEDDAEHFLTRFQAIDTTGFPEQEALNKRLMVYDLTMQIEDFRLKGWQMPVNQMAGIHINLPQLPVLLSFTTAKDYRDYVARLHRFPAQFEQTIEVMRQGLKDGMMPPKFLLEKVADQTERVAAIPIDESPFLLPLKHFPDSIPAAD